MAPTTTVQSPVLTPYREHAAAHHDHPRMIVGHHATIGETGERGVSQRATLT
jgi:hypothetical protein